MELLKESTVELLEKLLEKLLEVFPTEHLGKL